MKLRRTHRPDAKTGSRRRDRMGTNDGDQFSDVETEEGETWVCGEIA